MRCSRTNMLISTDRGVHLQLDTSSAVVILRTMNTKALSMLPKLHSRAPCSYSQLVASRGILIVLGTLFTVNLHDRPNLSLMQN